MMWLEIDTSMFISQCENAMDWYFQKKSLKYFERGGTRTHSLRFRRPLRYHCATRPQFY